MPRRDHDDLTAEITGHAAKIVAAEGIEGLTARRLAELGGCSVGTLYNLFGHIDGVIRAVNRETMRDLRAALTAGLATAPGDIETRLVALAETYLDFAAANPRSWDALFRSRLETPPEAAIEAEAERLFALLREAAGPAAEEEALYALWAAVHGVVELAVSRRLKTGDDQAQRRYIRLIVRAGLRGIAAPDPA